MQLPQVAVSSLATKRSPPCCNRTQRSSTHILAANQTSQGGPALGALADVAGGAFTRLQRYMQPPPAGDQSLGFMSDPLVFISRLRREYGPLVGLMLGGERVVLVADPAAARQVLVQQPDVFVKAGTAFFPGSSLTGNGLLVSDGEVWRKQRRLSNPAFRKAAVDRYADAMVTEAQSLLDGPWAEAAAAAHCKQQQRHQAKLGRASTAAATSAGSGPAGVRDVYADFNQLTLNITLSALFSISGSGSNGNSSGSRAAVIVAAVEKAFSYFTARGATAIVVPEWVPTPDNIAFREAVAQLDSLVYSIIDSRHQAAKKQQQQEHAAAAEPAGVGGLDLLQALLDAVDESGAPMSRSALRDELMTLLVAGQETSAILLGWAAALLAHNPGTQAAAAAEVASVLGSTSQQARNDSVGGQPACVSAADIPRLPLVTAVVLEALRLWSPAYIVGRCACRQVELAGGYVLPAGTTCLVSPYLLHREPTRWKQPAVFKPERWLPLLQPQQQRGHADSCPHNSGGNGDAPGVAEQPGCPMSSSSSSTPGYSFAAVLRDLGPNGAFVPFGGGPRNCIGTGFAMTEAVLVLAMVLQRYELQPVSTAAGFPRPKPLLTLRPEGVPLRVLPRTKQQQQQH